MEFIMKRFSLLILLASFLTLSSNSFARPSFSDKKDEWKDKASEWKDKVDDAKGKWKDKLDDAKDKWHDNDDSTGSGSGGSSFDNDDDLEYVRYFTCRYLDEGKWVKQAYFAVTSKRKSTALRRAKKRCENRNGEPFTIEVCEQITCRQFGRYE